MLHLIHWANATSDPRTKPTINNKHRIHYHLKETASIITFIITKIDRWLPTTGIIVNCCYYLEGEASSHSAAATSVLSICALEWILALSFCLFIWRWFAWMQSFADCLIHFVMDIHICMIKLFCFDSKPFTSNTYLKI